MNDAPPTASLHRISPPADVRRAATKVREIANATDDPKLSAAYAMLGDTLSDLAEERTRRFTLSASATRFHQGVLALLDDIENACSQASPRNELGLEISSLIAGWNSER